jgi:hypothetical protein
MREWGGNGNTLLRGGAGEGRHNEGAGWVREISFMCGKGMGIESSSRADL